MEPDNARLFGKIYQKFLFHFFWAEDFSGSIVDKSKNEIRARYEEKCT